MSHSTDCVTATLPEMFLYSVTRRETEVNSWLWVYECSAFALWSGCTGPLFNSTWQVWPRQRCGPLCRGIVTLGPERLLWLILYGRASPKPHTPSTSWFPGVQSAAEIEVSTGRQSPDTTQNLSVLFRSSLILLLDRPLPAQAFPELHILKLQNEKV